MRILFFLWVFENAKPMEEGRNNKQERMYALLDRWAESGMSQKAFCEEEGIGLPKFQYWRRRRKREQEGGGGFVPLQGEPLSSSGTMELILSGGVRLLLPLNTPAKKVHERAGVS
jgi:hypothetical protein